MLNRTVLKEIKNKLNTNNLIPVFLSGARQIGKTTLVKEVAKEYEQVIFVNGLLEDDKYKLFNENIDVRRIVKGLESIEGIKINEDTLIIIDEIQEHPNMYSSLKLFKEYKICKVLATGSYNAANNREDLIIRPIRDFDLINVYPLSFEEYLQAINHDALLEQLYNYKEVSEIVHDKLVEEFDNYLEISGMPEAIQAYVNGDKQEAINIKNRIYVDYSKEFGKYLTSKERRVSESIFVSIGNTLESDNQKLRISDFTSKGITDIETSVSWLVNNSLVIPVYQKNNNLLPIQKNISKQKLYYNDASFLIDNLQYNYSKVVLQQDFKKSGLIIENYIATVLNKKYDPLCYYLQSNNNQKEIDFLIPHDGNLIPVEVKSGYSKKQLSLTAYVKKYQPPFNLKVTRAIYNKEDNNIKVPYYAFEQFLEELSHI